MSTAEIVDAFTYQARELGVITRLGERGGTVEAEHDGHALVVMKSGKRLAADLVLSPPDATGPRTVSPRKRRRRRRCARPYQVNAHFETGVPGHLRGGRRCRRAVAASTSSEQGRLAACHMFGVEDEEYRRALPVRIYAIPRSRGG